MWGYLEGDKEGVGVVGLLDHTQLFGGGSEGDGEGDILSLDFMLKEVLEVEVTNGG